MASDIQRHLNNEPVVACPPSNLYRFQKLVRRNKLAFAAAGGIAAALVIGLAIALWQSIEKTRAYANSQQVAQFLKSMLQDLGPAVTLGHNPTFVRGTLDRAVVRIDQDLANQPEIAIELRSTVAGLYGEIGLYDRMEEIARKNLGLASSTFGDENLHVANALHQLSEAQSFRDQQAEAEKLAREALRIRRKFLGNEHVDVARSLRRLGNVLHRRATPAEVEEFYRQGLAICAKLGQQSLVEADLLDSLAVELRESRPDEAEQACWQSLVIKRKLLGNEHPSVCEGLLVLGLVLGEQGKVAERSSVFHEALALSRKLFGTNHPLVANALSGLGGTLADQGKLAEAESLLHDAVAMQRKVLGNEHFALTWTLYDLASVLERQERWADAEICYAEVLAIRKKLSANPRGHLFLRLASVLRKQGKSSEADALLPDAMAAFRKQADLGEIDAHNAIAWLLATHPDSTVRDGGTAMTYAEKAVAATTPPRAKYLDTLAAAYAEAGDFAKAVAAQNKAMALSRTEKEKQDFASRLKLYESATPHRERE